LGERTLMKGNEALGEAAVRAGCRFYFGYPITPQNELTAYMAKRMDEVGGVFLQSESEVAAINMIYGASAAGARAMTSSSGPGISLMQEGISYLAGAELPCVIVNVMRGGPGLGNIAPSQGDYFQATRGGGHGDYRTIVLAPYRVQEMADLTTLAFYLADKYRTPVVVLVDAVLGQMMEPVEFGELDLPPLPPKDWTVGYMMGRPKRLVTSLHLAPGALERHNLHLKEKYERIEREEVRWEGVRLEDAEVVLVAYGTSARVCLGAVRKGRREGRKVGLFRPITLWPFPWKALREVAERVKAILVVEMSLGQLVEDVRLAVEGRCPVHLLGRPGGGVPTVREVSERVGETLDGGGDEVVESL